MKAAPPIEKSLHFPDKSKIISDTQILDHNAVRSYMDYPSHQVKIHEKDLCKKEKMPKKPGV
jgi:hypothetical protein